MVAANEAGARWPRSWEPYLVPYAVFLGLLEVGGWLPEARQPWVLPFAVLVPGALFLFYWSRGCFPELGGYRPSAGGLAGDVACGLGIAALWLAPYVAGWLPHPEAGFDPGGLGEGRRALTLGLRLLGFAVVTPFVEELFVRSFLLRGAELLRLDGWLPELDAERDFRDLPMARYAAVGFWVTVVYFTFSHVGWERPVAFATGIVFNLWLYRRGHLGACVVAHAIANLAIALLVIAAARGGTDLWYFL